MTTVKSTKVIPKMIAVPEEHYAFWEKRMRVGEIIDELAIPWDSDASVMEIYHEIVAYCKEYAVMPRNVAWDVQDNVLYANNVSLRRVGPKSRIFACVEDEAEYWESRCLSMGDPVD